MISRHVTDTATYVYCVGHAEALHEDVVSDVAGVGENSPAIRFVQVDDLVAMVSDSPRGRVDISRRNLLAHQRVLEAAMQQTTVLPVAFGTVADSDRDVEEKLLRRDFDEIHNLLAYVRNRIEINVIVSWVEEQLYSEVVAENRDIRSLKDQLAGMNPDSTYYDRIDLGQRVERVVVQKSEHESNRILDTLAPLATETRVNEPLSELMILNAAFLVDRDRETDFDSAVEALGESERDRLMFKYVGPLPPYNFVHLSIQWED